MSRTPTRYHKTLVVNQSMATSNSFSVDLSSVCTTNHPKYMIIRQLIYANIAGADAGTYLIWCSLTSSYIGAVYVGIQGVQMNPNTVISVAGLAPSVTFQLVPAHSTFTCTGLLTLVLEFTDSDE